jgi:phosphotriesterase-related protein
VSELLRREFLAMLAVRPAAKIDGSILVHEHVMVDFAGADRIKRGSYDPDEVFRAARPKLEEVKRFGCRRLLECTPDFLGRDARLMRRLADATGVEIWINTGIYGAGDHKYMPSFAKQETAEKLAHRWIREAQKGIHGVRPRFIKTGVNKATLHELDRKLVRAAAITSWETGLPIASHTGDGAAALEQLEIVTAQKVAPRKFIWVHAQSERDHSVHERVARAGAWVEFDGIGPKSVDWHYECIRYLEVRDLLGRVLISQDAGWYHVGERGGGDYRGYTFIYTDFLPKLDPEFAWRLMVENPTNAFGK